MKTIKEIADELNTSKTTVRNIIANLNEKNFAKIGNKIVLDERQEKLIKSVFLAQSETKPQTKPQSESQSFSDSDEERFAILEEELLAKNRQIDAMQQTIDRLTQSLESVSRALEGAQALHAGSLQAQIEEKKERWKFWKRK